MLPFAILDTQKHLLHSRLGEFPVTSQPHRRSRLYLLITRMSKPDLVELLAHLDYLVTGPRQKSLSSEQWEEHMQKTLIELKAEFDNRYTTECIHDLLFAEFRRATAWPEFNMRRLFGHGSAELLLTPEMRKKVKDQLTLIQVRGPRKTRQSRSASSNRTRSLNTKAQKSGRLEARPKRSKLKKESNSMRVQSPQVRIYQVSAHRHHQQLSLMYRQSVDSASLQLPTPNGTVHVLPRELEVKETPCNSPLASVASKSIDKDVLELRQVPGDNTDVSSCRFELSDEKACSQEVGSHATASFRAMQNELSYYKQRCERAEEHLKATQKNNRRLKSMLEDPEDTLELLSTKDKRVRALEMELEARDKMGNYLDLSGLEAAQSHSQQLSVHFDTLKKDFSSIRVINSKKQYSITDLLGLSIDLNALMSAILPIGGPDALNGTPIINPAFTLYDITQALAGAAIHLWIFETPVAWHSLGTTPILQAYRRHIGMICTYQRAET